MKPRNSPGHKTHRQAVAKSNAGIELTAAERRALMGSKDIRIRVGKSRRTVEGLVSV